MKRYLALTIVLIGCSSEFDYPETEKKRGSYNVGGTTIYDPYIYMEDFQSEEVVNWSDSQNALTVDYLKNSNFEEIKSILKSSGDQYLAPNTKHHDEVMDDYQEAVAQGKVNDTHHAHSESH